MILQTMPPSGPGFKVFFEHRFELSTFPLVRVWLWEDLGDGRRRVWHFNENGEEAHWMSDCGAAIPDVPTFTMPEAALEAFAFALSTAGVRLPEESALAGKLEATRYHLEDLRKLTGLAPKATA